MIRSCSEEDEESFDNPIEFIIRNPEYKNDIYQINEEIKQGENLYKLYGQNKERNSNIVLTKVMNISEKENPNFSKRLLTTIKLIEQNILLVENLWLEKISENNYDLYVSELTNTIYRNEYNLITLNNYMSSTKNTYKDNIQILILIVQTLLIFQKYNFAHLNLHPNNIYINIKNNHQIYLGPPKLVKNYTNDSIYLWYSSPEEIFIENDNSNFNDIWSLGCIICELFFINFPLFQVYSPNEKILKIFDILGFPSFKEVEYMNKYQYDSLYKRSANHSKDNNLFDLLLSSKEKKSNLYKFKVELINIIKGCLTYDRQKRMKLEEILKRLEFLNSIISSEFHSEILETINVTEESETNNSNNKNNYEFNNITKNKSIESNDFNENNINNNIKENNNFNTITSHNTNSMFNNDTTNKEANKIEYEVNDIEFIEEPVKKEDVKYYLQAMNFEKEKDEYNELNKSKYNNKLYFYRN